MAPLSRELARIRRLDVYIRQQGELVAVVAPVWQAGRVVAALGIPLPAHRFKSEHRHRLTRAIVAAAADIGHGLEAMGPRGT
ncbi:MAG: hypothetical protein A3K19_27380 [Lentisphaerae bacterium RIFOXYB12_FULL_65_16]|nr:MAG: hypothetical protein A3K18_15895 [Lentisphaerae bacterium RIFOXYA12_64_32]OGV86413.1 MAG: hypothetical protein A3K19_27380 [Lentisphaerae bacterium RIFOXYB12_FULL_65_16]